MVVPYDSTTRRIKFLRARMPHFMLLWREVSWNTRVKFGWNNTFAHQETFGATVMMSPSGRTSFIFIVDGDNVVGSFVMRSTTSRNMVVPLDNTTLTYKFLQMSASHFTSEIWQEQNFRATETFGADGDEVFVWRLVGLLLVHFRGRVVYCVVIRAEVAQFFFDVTNKSSQQR